MRYYWICRASLAMVLAQAIPLMARTIAVEGHDGAAIQRAIDAANAGDTVQLPAGVYALADPIRPKSGVCLSGALPTKGQSTESVLRFAGTHRFAMLELHGCEGTELADLTIDGASDPRAEQGIVANESRHLLLQRLMFRDFVKGEGFGPHGIYFSGAVTDSAIDQCGFNRIGIGAAFGSGIRMSWGSSRNSVTRNTIADTGRGGIFGSDGSTDLQIIDNNVSGSHGEGLGIEVWHGCDRAVIEDNTIDHWLSCDGSPFSAVRRNKIGNAADAGPAKLAGLEFIGTHDCVFTDNLVDGGQNVGISQSNKVPEQRVLWAYNKVTRCPGWGMQLQGETAGIERQYFYRCAFSHMIGGGGPYPNDDGYGIRFNGNAHHLTFDECAITDNARLGIQLGGGNLGDLEFLRCIISGNKGAAMSDPGPHGPIAWTDCTIKRNASDALTTHEQFGVPAPQALIRMPEPARAGDRVQFQDASTPGAGATPIEHRLWDFGDGIPAVGGAVEHAFAKAGRYRVTLIVWDQSGRGAHVEQMVSVTSK